MPAISCLLFDLGGVLVRNAGFDRLNALLPAPLPLEALKTALLRSPAYRAFELGAATPDAFAAAFVAEMGLACTPADFIADFETWPLGWYDGATALLAQLRRHYRLACLSNSNALHWRRFDGFRGHFDVTLSSHLLGLIKPDAACFERALSACGVARDALLFFDDALVNVEAARGCGIDAAHVRDFDALRAELHARGLLPESMHFTSPT